jgi:all-trans-retinol 13,14-reductase
MPAGDVIIIGAGLSGLVDAILLAETGRKVLVLEQHKVPGGYLQQFRRKGTVFDVGFHYMGSTMPGRPMRQFLEYLGIWNRLRCTPLPADAGIEVRSGNRSFGYPTRFEAFHEKALATWPGDRGAVDRLIADTERLCREFKWLSLRAGREYKKARDLDLSPISLDEYLSSFVTDPWLREVLGFQSFNLGLLPHEIPWTKHLLAFRSNFDETSRIDGGGGALVTSLVDRGRELGVSYRFGSGVASFSCEKRQVRSVAMENGDVFEGDLFIAACHPKEVMARLGDEDLNPLFKERILEMKDSRGAFQLFLRLREPLSSLPIGCVMLRDSQEEHGDPPLHTILIVNTGEPRLEAMAYMDQAPFANWKDRPVLRRGGQYEARKGAIAERMIGVMAGVAPEISELILDTYTATPLSDEWYTRNTHGGVFGVSHDISQQGKDRPQPRSRLKNLFFTGHSIQMPGICGVFINSFDTCDAIRGDDKLFDALSV